MSSTILNDGPTGRQMTQLQEVLETGRLPTLSELLVLLGNENTLLETKTVAQISNLTPWWVRQLIARGELRAINVGSGHQAARWRVDPEDLKAFLASRESRPRDLVADPKP